MSRSNLIVVFSIAVFLSAFMTFVVVDTVTGESFQEYVKNSEEWCEKRGGTLYNAQVMGAHGGLHCHLPNGTHVHMTDVVDPP